MKIIFQNSQGKKVSLDDKLTMDDLVKMGISLKLEPNEKPKDPNPKCFYHTPKGLVSGQR